MAYTQGGSFGYGRRSSARALSVAGSTSATGPAEFWRGKMVLAAATTSTARRGGTFNDSAYFDIDDAPVQKVSFKQAEEDTSGW